MLSRSTQASIALSLATFTAGCSRSDEQPHHDIRTASAPKIPGVQAPTEKLLPPCLYSLSLKVETTELELWDVDRVRRGIDTIVVSIGAWDKFKADFTTRIKAAAELPGAELSTVTKSLDLELDAMRLFLSRTLAPATEPEDVRYPRELSRERLQETRSKITTWVRGLSDPKKAEGSAIPECVVGEIQRAWQLTDERVGEILNSDSANTLSDEMKTQRYVFDRIRPFLSLKGRH